MERAQRGERDAFEELVRVHATGLHAVVARLCATREEAEEVPEEAFLRAWRGIRGFQGDSQLFTWLYRIGVNEAKRPARTRRCRDARRASRARRRGPARHARRSLRQNDLRGALEVAVRGLPLDYRAPLILGDNQGLPTVEAAKLLDISVAENKRRLPPRSAGGTRGDGRPPGASPMTVGSALRSLKHDPPPNDLPVRERARPAAPASRHDSEGVADPKPRKRLASARAALLYCLRPSRLRRTLPIALLAGSVLTAMYQATDVVAGRANADTYLMCACNFLLAFALVILGSLLARSTGRRRRASDRATTLKGRRARRRSCGGLGAVRRIRASTRHTEHAPRTVSSPPEPDEVLRRCCARGARRDGGGVHAG